MDFIFNTERKNRANFVSNPTRKFPFVLLQEISSRNKFDYFLNLITESDEKIEESENFPEISIFLFIHERPLFLEEFFTNFAKQNYPKEKMNLFIFGGNFSKNLQNYKTIKILENVQEIKNLETKSEFFLILHSNAILEDPKTVKILVDQNLPFVAPLLETNFHKPSFRKTHNHGWNLTTEKIVSFPTSYMKEHEDDWRVHRGCNFQIFELTKEDSQR